MLDMHASGYSSHIDLVQAYNILFDQIANYTGRSQGWFATTITTIKSNQNQ